MFPASDPSSRSVSSRVTKSPYTCPDQYESMTSLHMLEEKDWQEDDAEMTEMTEMTKKMRETWGESAISLRVEVGIVGLVASCGCRRSSRRRSDDRSRLYWCTDGDRVRTTCSITCHCSCCCCGGGGSSVSRSKGRTEGEGGLDMLEKK